MSTSRRRAPSEACCVFLYVDDIPVQSSSSPPGLWRVRLLVEDTTDREHAQHLRGGGGGNPRLGGWALRRGDKLVRETPPTLAQPGGDGRLTR